MEGRGGGDEILLKTLTWFQGLFCGQAPLRGRRQANHTSSPIFGRRMPGHLVVDVGANEGALKD